MDPQQSFGKVLILTGLFLIVLGALFYGGRYFWFFGKLPGDIRIEKPNFKFYFPLTTCLLLSAVLSGILYLLSRLR